mgnify:CR=1 FL=1
MDVLALARKYENSFFDQEKALHILRPTIVCRATEHVQDMIEFVKTLEDKGLAYETGASSSSKFNSGLFFMYIGTNPENLETVQEDFDKEINIIAKIVIKISKQISLEYSSKPTPSMENKNYSLTSSAGADVPTSVFSSADF